MAVQESAIKTVNQLKAPFSLSPLSLESGE